MKMFFTKSHRAAVVSIFLSSLIALSITACGGGGGGGSGSGDGSAGGSGGSPSGITETLTNTTWLFVTSGSETSVCSGPHGTGKPVDDPTTPSGPGSSCTDTPKIVTTEEKKQDPVNEPRTGYYLHVDSNNIAYFGKVSFFETGTMYYDYERQVGKYVCSQHIASHETEMGEPRYTKKNIRYETTKSNYVFSPLAKGRTIIRNGKLNFEFPYGYAGLSDVNFFAYGLTTTGDDAIKVCKLLQSSNNSSYDNVAKISASELRIDYYTSWVECQNYQNSINDEKCLKLISTTYFTKWEKLLYDESLKGPRHDPASVLPKLRGKDLFFINGESGPVFNSSYDYISFVDEKNYKSESATYKGMDYFYIPSSSSATQKYWSHLKNAQDKDAIIFSEGSGTNWTYKLFYLGSDGVLYKNAENTTAGYKPVAGKFSDYVDSYLINENMYQHKKEYVDSTALVRWCEQNAEWVAEDNSEEYLKYSGASKYDAKFGGTTYTFTEFGELYNQKCLLIDTASKKSFLLTDKGRSIEITDGDGNVKTLSYSKRAGYEDSNYVEVTFRTNKKENYESIKQSFLNYDTAEENNALKVKLLKTTAINGLTSGDYPKVGKIPHGYELKIRSGSESGSEIDGSSTVASNTSLFIDVKPVSSAFYVTYKLGSRLAKTYKLYTISGFDNTINTEGTENRILVLPSDKMSNTYYISKKDYTYQDIEYKFMNGENEVSKDKTFTELSISGDCTINIVPTVDIVDYSIKFVPSGLTFNGSTSPINVNRTSINTIGGNDPSETLLNMVGAGQDYYWVYDNKVIYCSKQEVWDCGITGNTKLGELGLAEGANTITVKPIPMGAFILPAEFKTDRISVSITGLTSGTLVVDATKSTTVQAFTYMIMGSVPQTDMNAFTKMMSGFKLNKNGTAMMTINMMDQNPNTSKLSELGITENVTLTYESLQ